MKRIVVHFPSVEGLKDRISACFSEVPGGTGCEVVQIGVDSLTVSVPSYLEPKIKALLREGMLGVLFPDEAGCKAADSANRR